MEDIFVDIGETLEDLYNQISNNFIVDTINETIEFICKV
jgi:hypothetical protein